MRTSLLAGVLIVILITVSSASAFQVHNEELAFSLEIPEGFHEYNYLKPHSDGRTRRFVEKNTLLAYNKGGHPEENNYTGIFLYIERSGIEMLAGFNIGGVPANTEILNESWQGKKINLHRMERAYTTLGDRMVTLTAAIPLNPEPIQVKLSGDIRDETEMRRLLQKILFSLDGEVSIYAYISWLKYGLIVMFIGLVGLIIKRKVI